jgi:putative restriction endonuclease
MKIWIGITDRNWFEQLKGQAPEEVNFWQPGGTTNFKVLPEEGLFLFKLHHPDNYIVGGGYFMRHVFLPLSLAWKAFGVNNGVRDLAEFHPTQHAELLVEVMHGTAGGELVLIRVPAPRSPWPPGPSWKTASG